MSEYQLPADMPQDPEEITVEWAAERMREVRDARQSRNLTFPRFVRSLNRAGYEITYDEYKIIERAPKLSLPHVQEGILVYAAKVFNATRVDGSVQDAATTHAMVVISSARRAKGLTFADMSDRLTDLGVNCSEAVYRTAEQGITREVPFAVIAGSRRILDIPAETLFEH